MLKGTLAISLLRISSSRLLQCQVWLFIVLDTQLVEGKQYFKYNA
jgi:hypothetical protein